MDLLGQLAFPYVQDEDSNATLSKLILTDEFDSRRAILSLNDKKQFDSLKMIYTTTQQPIQHLTSYIENPDKEEKDKFPLLVKISPEFNKLKFHVSIKPETGFASRSLVIVKSIGITDVDILKTNFMMIVVLKVLELNCQDYNTRNCQLMATITYSKRL